jgi:hypothetical protein
MDEALLKKIDDDAPPTPSAGEYYLGFNIFLLAAALLALPTFLVPLLDIVVTTCPHGSVLHFGDQCIDLASLPRRERKVEVWQQPRLVQIVFGSAFVVTAFLAAAFGIMWRAKLRSSQQ